MIGLIYSRALGKHLAGIFTHMKWSVQAKAISQKEKKENEESNRVAAKSTH
jgi:hypothetical protein